MFSLFFGLYQYLFETPERNVVIVGLDAAGKTTLLEKSKSIFSGADGIPASQIVPTVGMNIGRMEAHGVRFLFWDLGGQRGLRSIWAEYFSEAHAIIFVVDAAAEGRFGEARAELDQLLASPDLRGAPLLVLLNKSDLLPASYLTSQLEASLGLGEAGGAGAEGGTPREYRVQAVSALRGDGVESGILWLSGVVAGPVTPEEEREARHTRQ